MGSEMCIRDRLKAEDKTFSYTGSVQTWTVPTGVSSIEVDGYGGMGGHGSSSWNGRGGFGGRLEATISVTAGDKINIYVGEKGGNTEVAGGTTYEPVYNPWTVGDAEGGWNGGGDPGNTHNGGGGGGPFTLEPQFQQAFASGGFHGQQHLSFVQYV